MSHLCFKEYSRKQKWKNTNTIFIIRVFSVVVTQTSCSLLSSEITQLICNANVFFFFFSCHDRADDSCLSDGFLPEDRCVGRSSVNPLHLALPPAALTLILYVRCGLVTRWCVILCSRQTFTVSPSLLIWWKLTCADVHWHVKKPISHCFTSCSSVGVWNDHRWKASHFTLETHSLI